VLIFIGLSSLNEANYAAYSILFLIYLSVACMAGTAA
jgi:hypothetical protein